jgi:shikimate kinase
MNIVLIGYRGTGKTSVGMALSKRLGRDFCDTDDYIEKRLKMPIREMVAREGWTFFRAKEKEAIHEVSCFKDYVIAAGGGVVLDAENVKHLKKNGIVVLLEATTTTILERMHRDKMTEQQRPSLTGKDPYEEIEEVLEFRKPLYQKAMDFSVDTTSKAIDQVVGEVVQKLEKYGG